MDNGIKGALIVIVVIAVAMFALRKMAGEDGSGAKGDIMAEVQQWDGWGEFDELLLPVIDAEHERVFAANYTRGTRRQPSRFEELAYRSMMYQAMREVLAEHGHDEASIKLDQYRVRINNRR